MNQQSYIPHGFRYEYVKSRSRIKEEILLCFVGVVELDGGSGDFYQWQFPCYFAPFSNFFF